jgi:hypothetical protein
MAEADMKKMREKARESLHEATDAAADATHAPLAQLMTTFEHLPRCRPS